MNPKGDEPFTMFGTTFRGAKIVRSPASDNAKRHMTRSWTFTGAATLVALALVFWHRIALPGVALALGMSAYGAWASYWGVVGVSGAMLDPNRKRGNGIAFRFLSHQFGLLGVVGFPLLLGILYGTLGGG